jgi:hypothetical protein
MAPTRQMIDALERQRAAEALGDFVVASAYLITAEDDRREPDTRLIHDLIGVGERAIKHHLDQVDPQRRKPIDVNLMRELVNCATLAMTGAWSTTDASLPQHASERSTGLRRRRNIPPSN